jgi:ABC-type Fe3+/spermidine/putrescine transport system ATPase subunit
MTHFELQSVSKSYGGKPVLSQVSLTFEAGRHTAVVGPSGCGKSTLLRMIAGLDAPSSGRVLMDGEVISQPGAVVRPPHRRHLAMVFQDLALWPNLSVLGNVSLGLAGERLPRQRARARADEAIAICGIAALAERKPGQLSGGQQQRLALARAMAARPTFLLLDEPFASLDLSTKDRLLAEIQSLAERQALTLIIVTHDPLEATTLCQHAVVLDDGALIESGPWDELLRSPQSALLRLFRDRVREISSEASEPEELAAQASDDGLA